METIKKNIWVIIEDGHELMFVCDNEPKKTGDEWECDGIVIELPTGSIRNLTQRFNVHDKPIKVSNKQQKRVSYNRNIKNNVMYKLLKEKYGENQKAGLFLEAQRLMEEKIKEKEKEERE